MSFSITFALLIALTVIIVVIICLIYKLKADRRLRLDGEQVQCQIVHEAARQLVSTLITPRNISTISTTQLSNVHIQEIA